VGVTSVGNVKLII